MNRKWTTILRAVLTVLVVFAGAVAVPILWRSFFYLHIQPLDLTE